MQSIYQTFEFEKIKDFIREYSKTERGHQYIDELDMFDSFDNLNTALEDLKEAMSLIQRFGPLPISPSLNAIRIINDAKKTSILTPRDLDMVAEDVLTSIAILDFIKKLGGLYPRIESKIQSFADLRPLEKEIHRCINSAQAVKDDASEELKRIRDKIKKTEQILQDKMNTIALSYSTYLNDSNATIRDGHLVLPVKTASKSKVPGIIYDVSDSGNTTFIEPLEIVQINNQLTALKVEENEEIRKILKQLTALVLLQEDEILHNNQIIAELDFLCAKSLYGLSINGEVASLSKEMTLTLNKARHPLIDPKKVVSNNYHLDDEKRIVIISGPNAGGKTVSLKTVGLLSLMHLCGLPIPVEKGEIPFFKHIYIDIGDNQSLSDNLSTFSGHMSHISEIIQEAGGKDLILIDELGTGTDPKEGEALAFALTKYLESKHCFAFISSHFDALKEYAFLSEHLDNASMLFNEEKLEPTYIFKQGAPGKSYALDVANRYGIKQEIVDEAKEFLKSKGSSDTDELTSVLLSKINETSKLEKELQEQKAVLDRNEKRYEKEKSQLEERKEKLLEDVKIQREALIKEAKDEISDILSEMRKSNLTTQEVIELRKQLEELEEKEEEIIYDEVINKDDYVSIPSLNMNGKVTSINGSKAKVRSDSGFTFEVSLNKLHKVVEPTKEVSKVHKSQSDDSFDRIVNTSLSLELNIIGMRVDEAMTVLEKYIDNCRLKHLSQVRIIHGYGSGALRNATRKYLDTQKDLTYRPGGEYEGGGGATVVTFK